MLQGCPMTMAVAIALTLCAGWAAAQVGQVVVLRDPDAPGQDAPTTPETLAELLGSAGYTVRFATGDDLATGDMLRPERCDLLVLAYGSAFPRAAVPALREYLQGGGSFLSVGGYAFDDLYGAPEAQPLLRNGGFEEPGGWEPNATDATFEPTAEVARSGRLALRISTPTTSEPHRWRHVWQRLDLQPGVLYALTAHLMTRDMKGGRGYCAVEFYDAQGQRIGVAEGMRSVGYDTQGWEQVRSHWFTLPAQAEYARACLILYGHGTAYFDDVAIEVGTGLVNTHWGTPQDGLEIEEQQIGVFDPSFRLERAQGIRAAEGQHIVPADTALDAPTEGFAASAVLGPGGAHSAYDVCRRHIPLLTAVDRYGRPRGSAGALVLNYAGLYRGSAWLVFGVTNQDLFAPDRAAMRRALLEAVAAALRKTFLERVATDLACYRDGETVSLQAAAWNLGKSQAEAAVRFEVLAQDEAEAVFEETVSVPLPPGARQEATASWSPGRFARDFYRVRAVLLLDGRPVDEVESGFAVRDEALLTSGPALTLRDNYLCLDGAPHFLTGTNVYGYSFGCQLENPLTWDRDLRRIRDAGLSVVRVIHYSPFWAASDLISGDGLSRPQTEPVLRQFDAFIQLCRKHRLIPYLEVANTPSRVPSDEEAQVRASNPNAARYTTVSALLWEVDNEWEWAVPMSREDPQRATAALNEFLRQRYGTTEALREAWREAGLEFGSVPLPTESEQWGHVPTADLIRFWTEATRQGAAALLGPVKSAAPHQLTSVSAAGTLPLRGDPILSSYDVDLSNIHFYGASDRFCSQFKVSDMRALGKSFSLGEFGAKVHPAWGERPEPEAVGVTMDGAVNRFLQIGHCALGLGASFIANWGWKDTATRVFPWGLNYPCDEVPKDVLRAYRSMSLLFRSLRPRYEPPSVAFVLPDEHRLGPARVAVANAIFTGLEFLLGTHTDFLVINEERLADLPSGVRTLLYPIPFCPADETFERLLRFVEAGGSLYLSGDISYAPDRRRTRTDRLTRLCGVKFVRERYPALDHASAEPTTVRWTTGEPAPWEGKPCISVRATTAQTLAADASGAAVVTLNPVGAGRVLYCADPVELTGSPAGPQVYRRFLAAAAAPRNEMSPNDPALRLFRLRATSVLASSREGPGDDLYVAHNPTREQKSFSFGGPHRISLTLPPWKPGLALVGPDGDLRAVEGSGEVTVDGEVIVSGDAHAMIVALDGADLRRAEGLLIMPLTSGRLRLSRAEPSDELVVEVGELRDGAWTRLAELPPSLDLQIDEDLRLEMILAVRRPVYDEVTARLAGLL